MDRPRVVMAQMEFNYFTNYNHSYLYRRSNKNLTINKDEKGPRAINRMFGSPALNGTRRKQ